MSKSLREQIKEKDNRIEELQNILKSQGAQFNNQLDQIQQNHQFELQGLVKDVSITRDCLSLAAKYSESLNELEKNGIRIYNFLKDHTLKLFNAETEEANLHSKGEDQEKA